MMNYKVAISGYLCEIREHAGYQEGFSLLWQKKIVLLVHETNQFLFPKCKHVARALVQTMSGHLILVCLGKRLSLEA